MKYLPLLILSLVLFGGCMGNTQNSDIKSSEIYKGYPCFGNCEEFQAGYELADKQALERMEACTNFTQSQLLGCKARVQEHIIKEREDNWMGNIN